MKRREILPAGARLADARTGIEHDLAEQHATCVVLTTNTGDLTTSVAPAFTGSRSTGVTP